MTFKLAILFSCDLHLSHRNKLLNCLNKSFETNEWLHISHSINLTLTTQNFQSNLMSILSPHTTSSLINNAMKIISNLIHPKYDTPDTNTTTPKKRHCFAVNCFCTFLLFVLCRSWCEEKADSIRNSNNVLVRNTHLYKDTHSKAKTLTYFLHQLVVPYHLKQILRFA